MNRIVLRVKLSFVIEIPIVLLLIIGPIMFERLDYIFSVISIKQQCKQRIY